MAVRLLSNQNVNGDIDVNHSQNAITYVAVTNTDTGVAANSRVQVVGESAQLDMIATSAGYTGVTGWADAGIITTDSGASGGLKLNSQDGGIQLQIGTTSHFYLATTGNVGINDAGAAATSLSVKDTQDSTFTSGISVIRSANSDVGYINMVGGAFNLNSTKNTKLRVSDTTKLEVRSSGINVIGETETDTLKVTGSTEFSGGATFGGNIIIYNSTNAPYIDFVESGATSDSKARITMDQVDTDNGTLLFSTEGSGTLSERMRIGSNGYVGMGIANTNNQRITLAEADANGSHIKMNNSRTGGGYWVNGVGDDGSSASIVPPGGIFWYNGATRMVIDSAGNVGIGTTSPGAQLEIAKQTTWGTLNNQVIYINNTGTGGDTSALHDMGSITWRSGSVNTAAISGIRNTPGSGNNVDLRFTTATQGGGQQTSMTILSGGNVGIGIINPVSLLTIGGATTNNPHAAADDVQIRTAIDGGMTISCGSDSGTGSIFFGDTSDNAKGQIRYNHNTDDFTLTAADNIILSGDKVGIGTTSPDMKLDVAGNIRARVAGNVAGGFYIGEGDTSEAFGLLSQGANGYFKIRDEANSADRFYISHTGNVGIGTTTPNYKLSVANASTRIVSINYQDSINTIMSHAGAPNYGLEALTIRGDYIAFYTDYDTSHYQGLERMRIDSSGNVGIGNDGTNIVVTGKGLGIQNIGQDTTASMRLTGANATGNPGVATYTELKHYGADLKFGINHNGGTDVITINSSKNVGIGITPKSWTIFTPIQIGQASSFVGRTSSNQTDVCNNWYYDGAEKRINTGYAQRYVQDNSGAHYWLIGGTDAADSAISFSTAMYIKNDGNVGIGTTSPKRWR
jgi:hypothetical protein